MLAKLPVKFLTAVAVELTNDCNLDCEYCHRRKREVGYMDLAFFKRVVTQLPRYVRLCLSYGGESILHPQFSDILKICKKHVFRRVRVYSNGLVKYPDGVDVIIGSKPPDIVLSYNQQVQSSEVQLKPVRNFCHSLFHYVAILWNGDVTVCCHDVAGVRVVGNVTHSNLSDIWNGPAYQKLRELGFCEGCEIYKFRGF